MRAWSAPWPAVSVLHYVAVLALTPSVPSSVLQMLGGPASRHVRRKTCRRRRADLGSVLQRQRLPPMLKNDRRHKADGQADER